MHHKKLQEIAKFASGVIACDIIVLMWLYTSNISINFLGRAISEDVLIPSIVFDGALLLFLIHYGWNIGKIPSLRERTYFLLSGIIFAVVSVVHVLRILTDTSVAIGEMTLPLWGSWLGVAIAAYLAYMSFHLTFRKGKK